MPKRVEVADLGPINKVYIANRGDAGFRGAKAADKRGIIAVIPYTFSDPNSLSCDLAVRNQDKGWELSALGGGKQEENYANITKIIEEIKLHRCDAVYLGWGFKSEDADFVRLLEQVKIDGEKLKVLGPPSEMMELMSNKIKAREIVRKVKIGRRATIPVLEGSGDLPTLDQAQKEAQRIKFPIMLKDPDSGGGAGNRVARNAEELEKAYMDLRKNPQNKQIFMETYVEDAIHIEVQIIADNYGNIVVLGERDCTLQRKSQKIIEESPSVQISDRQRAILHKASVNIAKAVHYVGPGVVEYTIDRNKKGVEGDPAWAFGEMNVRVLQCEHGVTEQQLQQVIIRRGNGEEKGIDILDLAMDIAEGKPLPFTQADIIPQGHTIEARVYAENPDRNFGESFGTVNTLRYPEIEGVRVDPALKEGDTLSQWFDHTLFKGISHAKDRDTARENLIRLLSGSEVVGVSSTLHFLIDLLNTPTFRNGEATTTFVERWARQRLTEKVHSISDFIGDGTFVPYPPSKFFNPALMPQTSTVVSRRDGREITYQNHLERLQREKGRTCAAEYGILEREGVRVVLFNLDFDINAGAMGPQEGSLFVDACKLAHEENLPLVSVCSTAGIDNWTNTPGLHQMGHTVAAVTSKYPPKFYVSVFHGFGLGGPPAGVLTRGDILMIVDAEATRVGFAGAYLAARSAGIVLPENTRATEVYEELAKHDPKYEGFHSPQTLYHERVMDIFVDSLREASDKIIHLIHNLDEKNAIVDKTRVFRPTEQIALREGASEVMRFDRPGGRFKFWFGRSKYVDRILERVFDGERHEPARPLKNSEVWKLIYEPYRPTAADLLDTRLGMFDDTVLLSGDPLHFEKDTELYPPIIAATARIEDIHFLVLAQQTQRIKDERSGEVVKRYHPPRPQDWEYAIRKLKLGTKEELVLLHMADIEGADNSPDSETRGQIIKLGDYIEEAYKYPFTSLAVLLGIKGSGGGETFFRPFDSAAAAENSRAFVADPRTKSWIQGGHWLDDTTEEFAKYIDGEETARPEVMLRMGLIDHIIQEGPGGAHRNARLFARNLREWALARVRYDRRFSISQRLDRRWERSEGVNEFFNAPLL